MTYQCGKCKSSFTTKSNLRKHIKRLHPQEDVSKLAPLHYRKNSNSPNSKIRCNICDKTFNHSQSLRRHRTTHISDLSSNQTPQSETQGRTIKHLKKCPLCDYSASFKKELLDHFQNVHEIPLHWHNLNFSSVADFNQWKEETENQTNSRFIKKKAETFRFHKSIQYACHRSGNYFPEGKGLRHLKMKGSCKINAYCPATIKVVMENAGNIKVDYLESHVGHELDIGHLHLTKLERDNIASKIAAKIPFEAILDGIRDPITDNEPKRFHLLTKKNLFNTQQAIITQLPKKQKTRFSIEERQQNLLMQFQEILPSGNSHKKLEAIEKILDSLPPTLTAIDNNDMNKPSFSSSNKNNIHNESIERQRRILTTKKKSKKTVSSLRKPSQHEPNTMAV